MRNPQALGILLTYEITSTITLALHLLLLAGVLLLDPLTIPKWINQTGSPPVYVASLEEQ
jgi:hypothetical protein